MMFYQTVNYSYRAINKSETYLSPKFQHNGNTKHDQISLDVAAFQNAQYFVQAVFYFVAVYINAEYLQ